MRDVNSNQKGLIIMETTVEKREIENIYAT